MLRHAGVAAIRMYQRHLSPRKGYCCAYGVLHGCGTCSSVGLDIMKHEGVWAFLRKMPLQFKACRVAASTLNDETPDQKRERRRRMREEGRKQDCSGMPCDTNFVDFEICEAAGGIFECASCEFGSCF